MKNTKRTGRKDSSVVNHSEYVDKVKNMGRCKLFTRFYLMIARAGDSNDGKWRKSTTDYRSDA